MGLALVHLIGALGSTFAFGVVVLLIAAREQDRVKNRRIQDASIALGVPVAVLEHDESLIPQLLEYSARRFSAELLRNRISDLCGILRTVWGWLGAVIQFCIVVGVAWSMYSEGIENAVVMWAVPVVGVFFWLTGVAFSFACLLVTGRYPGEAKLGRKSLATFIEQRNASAAQPSDTTLSNAGES